ncbi:MAG: M23 family metallopeptidase [Patescibacteria group bacterium]
MKRIAPLIIALLVFPPISQAETLIDLVFPVEGAASFSDDFDDQRSGHLHHATDITAAKMTPVLAAMAGEVSFAPMEEPSYGYMITINGDDGYEYNYIHLNNDTPGSDDGVGGAEHAYAPGIERGVHVNRGEQIAWVGDSGNAESVGAHLHFEIYDGDTAINPYPSLLAAYGNDEYDFNPAFESANATSIDIDQNILEATEPVNCVAGSLIRTEEFTAVYYCGRDGGRYVFQNESAYFSWFTDFEDVMIISSDAMGSIPIRGTVTYKPGTYLIKLLSVPNVYAVAANGTLRWVTSPTMAASLYGDDWPSLVRDLPDGFFPAYHVGEEIARI